MRRAVDTIRKHRGKVKWTSIGLIAVALVVIARGLPLDGGMRLLEEWIEGLGPAGPIAYAAVYAVATVLLVPGWILTVAAGAIFGMVTGTIVVSAGSTTGAALAFLIARYAARRTVAETLRKRPKLEAVDRAVGDGGWRIVALLRLSPAVPFNVQNYLYGLTPIGFWPCIVASWIAMLPATILYVSLGRVAGAAAGADRRTTTAEWVAMAVGLAATVAVTVYLTRLARRRLRSETAIAPGGDGHAGRETSSEPDAPWGTIGVSALAVVAVAAAVWVRLERESIEAAVDRLLGPPRVELREAYTPRPDAPDFDHGRFDAILKAHVREGGWVDYRALPVHDLEAYLEQLAAAPFDELGRDGKLALLINAYNAFTLRLILDHSGEDALVGSIRDIPAEHRWDDRRWRVGGRTWSLNEIEHEQIRPMFDEPRIHFALVCAAVGCPPLRAEAYTPDRLEEQLADQAAYVHRHPRWFAYDPQRGVVRLTALYRWYRGDFEQAAGSVLAYAARHAPGLGETLAAGGSPTIEWIDYDWRLNSVENRQASP